MFYLDNINIAITIAFFINLIFLVSIFKSNYKNKQVIFYAFNVISVLIWSLSMFFYRNIYMDGNFWLKVLYASALWPGITFLLFLFRYPVDVYSKYKDILNSLLFIYTLATLLSFKTDLFVKNIYTLRGQEPVINFGDFYVVYIFLVSLPFVISFLRLGYFALKTRYKSRVWPILLGSIISSQIAFVTNLMLPWFGNFDYNWVGQVATVGMITSMTYAVIKYDILNIRLLLADVIAFVFVLLSFIQFLYNYKMGSYGVSIYSLVASLVAALILVKLSRKERQNLNKTIQLNEKLEYFNNQLKTLDQRKTEFINIASHQLRTPVVAIKGYSDLALRGVYGPMTADLTDQVKRIKELSNQIFHLVTDMLNISRIEENRLVYRFEEVDLNKFIKDICVNFESSARQKNLEYNYNIMPESLLHKVDKTLFTQCIENIIDNAIKYTNEGKIEVSTFVKDGKFYMKCVDTGLGIDKASQENLFKKFSRSDNARRSGIDGSGIGMYLAKEIMRSHNGDIDLTSAGEGRGTTALLSIDLI